MTESDRFEALTALVDVVVEFANRQDEPPESPALVPVLPRPGSGNGTAEAKPVATGSLAGVGIRARLQLYWRDERCYWCDQQTVLFIPKNAEEDRLVNSIQHNATMDHVPNRGDWLVNACTQCNSLRNTIAIKMAVNKRISRSLLARWRPLLERWIQVGRPETKQLAEYALARGPMHAGHRPVRPKGKRWKMLEVMVLQMMTLAQYRAEEEWVGRAGLRLGAELLKDEPPV